MTSIAGGDRRLSEALRRDGFCIVPGVLDDAMLAELKSAADELGEAWTARAGDAFKAQGSMVPVPKLEQPVFGELVVLPELLAALDRLGLDGATFTDGYVISKPGRGPRLFWHLDWYGWGDESAYQDEPLQVFAMYYLTDTTPENGCLRVIPGSHTTRHALHDVMADGHIALNAASDLDRPEFTDVEGEVDVPVRAGDVVIGDARLLHAAHTNRTDGRRSLITLWYQPHFDRLPRQVQATLAAKTQELPATWPADLRDRVAAQHPRTPEGVAPLARVVGGPR